MVFCFLPDPNIDEGPGLLILKTHYYTHDRDQQQQGYTHIYNDIKENLTVHVVQNMHWANPDQTAPSGEGLAVLTLFDEAFLS